MSRQHAAPHTFTTLTFDGPHTMPFGGQYIRAVVMDEHGCELDAYMIDTADHNYAASAEHPDASHLGWPADYPWTYAFTNGSDESWGAPSWEAAVDASLFELATRLHCEWYDDNSECRFASGHDMTEAEVREVLQNNPNAAIYCWHGRMFLDDSVVCQMIDPAILCALNEAGVIAPADPTNASIWLAI